MTDPTPVIRETTIQDTDAIAAIHVSTWQHAYKSILPNHFLSSLSIEERKRIRKQYLQAQDPQEGHFVAVINGKVVGFTDVGVSQDEDRDTDGEIYTLYVDPAYLNKKVGSSLLKQATATLRGLGFKKAVVWMIQGDVQRKQFYTNHGWLFDNKTKVNQSHGVSYTINRYMINL